MNRDLPMTGFANLRNARNLRSTSRRALSANGSAGSKRVDRSFRGKVWKWANLQLGGMYHVRFCDTTVLWAYLGDVVLAKVANERRIPMIMSGSSLTRLEEVAATAPGAWFQAYLPGEPDRIDALVDRVLRAGFQTLVLTVDTATLANRENNIRAGFSTPLLPSLRLAWQGITHPRWTIGTFLRTLAVHGVPHFENSYGDRGAPIISSNFMRDFGRRDHLNWVHLERIRARWPGKLVVKGVMHPDDALRVHELVRMG